MMKARVEITGGCHGHWGEDDRCYCDSPDVHVEFDCPNAIEGNYDYVGEGKKRKLQFIKNKNRCKQPTLKIGALSDQYSLARWFTEHYEPSDGDNVF